MTITCTPQPTIGSCKIVVTAPPGTQIVSVYREDTTGQTPIRTISGLLPAATVTLEDYEAPLSEPISYTALASNNTAQQAATQINANTTVLAIPQTPARRVILPIITDMSISRKQPGAADQIIGRPEPLCTILPLGARTGSLKIICDDYAQARQIEALYATGYTLHLRQPSHTGLNLYHLAESCQIKAITRQGLPAMWEIDIAYVEQARPLGPLVGTLGWDYQHVAACATDYYQLATKYTDLADLAAGDD